MIIRIYKKDAYDYSVDIKTNKEFTTKRASSWHRQKETRRKKAKQGRSSRRKPKRNYILKGIVECANGQQVFRYNYRNGSNRSDLDCHQTSEKPQHYCLNKCRKIGEI